MQTGRRRRRSGAKTCPVTQDKVFMNGVTSVARSTCCWAVLFDGSRKAEAITSGTSFCFVCTEFARLDEMYGIGEGRSSPSLSTGCNVTEHIGAPESRRPLFRREAIRSPRREEGSDGGGGGGGSNRSNEWIGENTHFPIGLS